MKNKPPIPIVPIVTVPHVDRLGIALRNIKAVRKYYSAQTDAGQVVGHHILLEIVFSNFESAISAACKGEEWSPK